MNILKPLAVILSTTLCIIAYAQVGFDDELLFDPTIGEVPHVLSAVRLHQPTAEVPASVTVLDAQFIKATGAKNIQDLFRYVPGMLVVPEPYDNSDSVVYHGGPGLYPKSMEVLIDGVAAYRSGLAAVGWNSLSVSIEEIQRIEVVRGPNSTTYGTNAYKAVVNIITKHPSDTLSERSINFKLGDNNDHYIHGQSGFNFAGGEWRLTAVDKGTDHLANTTNERIRCETDCPNRRDSSHVALRGFYELSDTKSFDAAINYIQTERKLPHYTVNDNQAKDTHYEVGVRYYYEPNPQHKIKISGSTYSYQRLQEQREDFLFAGTTDPALVALFRINPLAADQIAQGLSPTALDLLDPEQARLAQQLAIRYANPADFLVPLSATSDVETTEVRADIEIQDTYAITQGLTLLSGIGYRYDKVSSDTYYKDTILGNSWRIFGNINWLAAKNWSLHAGIMNEKSELDESALSFRAAANYLISSVESIRFVYSEASKTPDFIEEYADWTYKLENIETTSPYAGDQFYRALIVDGGLDSQKIRSFEIGYYGRSNNYRTEWDVRSFYEKLTDLIYIFPTINSDAAYADNTVECYGVEWQLIKEIFSNTSFRYTGAFIKADSTTAEEVSEEDLLTIYSPLSQTISLQTEWSNSLNSMLSLFWIKDLGAPSANSDQQVNTHRLDLNIYGTLDNRSIREVSWAVSVQHDFSKDPYVTYGRGYEQSTRFQIELGLNF